MSRRAGRRRDSDPRLLQRVALVPPVRHDRLGRPGIRRRGRAAGLRAAGRGHRLRCRRLGLLHNQRRRLPAALLLRSEPASTGRSGRQSKLHWHRELTASAKRRCGHNGSSCERERPAYAVSRGMLTTPRCGARALPRRVRPYPPAASIRRTRPRVSRIPEQFGPARLARR